MKPTAVFRPRFKRAPRLLRSQFGLWYRRSPPREWRSSVSVFQGPAGAEEPGSKDCQWLRPTDREIAHAGRPQLRAGSARRGDDFQTPRCTTSTKSGARRPVKATHNTVWNRTRGPTSNFLRRVVCAGDPREGSRCREGVFPMPGARPDIAAARKSCTTGTAPCEVRLPFCVNVRICPARMRRVDPPLFSFFFRLPQGWQKWISTGLGRQGWSATVGRETGMVEELDTYLL